MTEITGGCLCGKVRYTLTGEPLATMVCHCTHCQKQTGTSFSILLAAKSAAVSVTGTLASYADEGSSGQPIRRKFCSTCGSPILSEPDVAPGMVFLKAGTLDDTKGLNPTKEIWCQSAQSWVPHPETTEKFEQGR